MPCEVPFERRGPQQDAIDVRQRRERRIARVTHPTLERDPRGAPAVLELARLVLERDEDAARGVELRLREPSRPIHTFGALDLDLGDLELIGSDARQLLDVIALEPRERGLTGNVDAGRDLLRSGTIGFARVALRERLAHFGAQRLLGEAGASDRIDVS